MTLTRPLVVLAIAACSGSAPPAPPAAPVVIATPRLSVDDVAVAVVNGRSVWGSCVAAQAQAIARASGSADVRRAALDQCIAFELLAQAAEARGLGASPEVASATRTAMVSRLIELDFEQHYRTPADLKHELDLVLAASEWRLHTLELRASSFARFLVPKDAAPGLDTRAHALADQLAAELAGQTGLFGVHVAEAARRLAAGSEVKVESADVRPRHHDDLVTPYAEALYAIREVGRTSAAVRTPWGWDVVLWTGGVEAKEHTADEVETELFPGLRRRQFQLWATQVTKRLGVHIEIDQATVAKLDSGAAP